MATAVPSTTPIPTNTPLPPATVTETASATVTATATNPPIPTNTPRPPATATAAVTNLTIGTLPESLGQEVTISGTVINTASFAGGFKFTLSDGTGQVTLLMWHNVYDDCWAAPELNRGATVQATGEVGMFEGELQVVPDFGGDVRVTAVGPPFAPDRNIGDLGNHMGELVQITGQINRVEGISSGAKLFITDDTGEILVFVWSNILDRVPNNVSLGVPGTRVRIVGAVQEFRSNREIVPSLPYDIEVLP
jgi:RecJ-like exonuclease